MVPCQDTPAVKAPYSAIVVVPAPLTVVMSANQRQVLEVGDAFSRYEFHQTTAISVGKMDGMLLGLTAPRSRLPSHT